MISIKASYFLLVLFLAACSSPENSQSELSNMSQAALMDSLDVPDHVRQLENLSVFDANQPPSHTFRLDLNNRYDSIVTFPATVGGGEQMVVDNRGRAFLKNMTEHTVEVFNVEGIPITQLGREGRGPGEFVMIASLTLSHGELAAYDISLKRMQYFPLDSFSPIRTVNMAVDGLDSIESSDNRTITSIWHLYDNRYLAEIGTSKRDGRTYRNYYLIDEQGKVLSKKLFDIPIRRFHSLGGGRAVDLPFSDKGIVTVSPSGHIYYATTSEFLIHRLDPESRKLSHIYYPIDHAPLHKNSVLDEMTDFYASALRDVEFPAYWPALESMFVDSEDRLWISTITNDRESYTWWILNKDGRLMDRVTLPREKHLRTGNNGHVYALISDFMETGTTHIERYRLTLSK